MGYHVTGSFVRTFVAAVIFLWPNRLPYAPNNVFQMGIKLEWVKVLGTKFTRKKEILVIHSLNLLFLYKLRFSNDLLFLFFNNLGLGQLPPAHVTWKLNINPLGTPQLPLELTAMLWHSPLVPDIYSLMCSIAAFPALDADDSFFALMMTASLFYTVGVKSFSIHSLSTNKVSAFPLTL